MERNHAPEPTERELQILRILWRRGEATVREVSDELRDDLGIVQNTVQTFLRTMTEKGLAAFRKDGRTFVYRATVEPAQTRRRLLDGFLSRAFDGAIDQLVESAVALRRPTDDEVTRLRQLLDEVESEVESEARRREP